MAKKNPIRTAQSEKYHGDEWWSWSVWIDAPLATLRAIASVEYTLHPTFNNPVRIVKTRSTKFKLSSAGWGVFPIHIRVTMRDGREQQLRHQLKLHYPSGEGNTA